MANALGTGHDDRIGLPVREPDAADEQSDRGQDNAGTKNRLHASMLLEPAQRGQPQTSLVAVNRDRATRASSLAGRGFGLIL